MNQLDIYRNGALFTTIKPSNNSVQEKKIMGDNKLSIDFESSVNLQFQVGDYTTVFGEIYKINTVPVISKLSTKRFKYSMSLEGEYFDLTKAQFLFYDAENRLREGDFSLMANLTQFSELLTKNISRVLTGWSFGEVPASAYKNITFSNESCLEAIIKIVEAFETEFWIEGKKISFIKKNVLKDEVYKHGQNNGLYEINRTVIEKSQLVTRVYPFGSDKNIPADYNNYSKRLRLAEKDPRLISRLTCSDISIGVDGLQKYVFHWTTPESSEVDTVTIKYRRIGTTGAFTEDVGPKANGRELSLVPNLYEFMFQSNANSGLSWTTVATSVIPIKEVFSLPLFQANALPYVQSNVDKYGVIEKAIIFEDIFPTRTGRVSSINAANPYEFSDVDIDFDVNDYLLGGMVAKVTFNTGQLAGYTFDISIFINADKKFKILKNKNENQIDIPSPLLKPEIGDLYVLTDIKMPLKYIEAAEQKLVEKANEYLNIYSFPTYSYTIVFDPAYLKNRGKIPMIGDVVWLQDSDLELNKPIRIISTTRNIVEEYKISVEMADILSSGTIKSLSNSISSISGNVNSVYNDIRNNNLLQNNKTTGDFKIEQGTINVKDIPERPITGTFKLVYFDEITGNLYKA